MFCSDCCPRGLATDEVGEDGGMDVCFTLINRNSIFFFFIPGPYVCNLCNLYLKKIFGNGLSQQPWGNIHDQKVFFLPLIV